MGNHVKRVVAGCWEDSRRAIGRALPKSVFGRVLVTSAVLHVALATTLYVVRPAPYYGWSARDQVVRRPERPPMSPEPLTPIPWHFETRLNRRVYVRATAPLDEAVLARWAELYDRALALFPAYAGRSWISAGALDLRVVPVAMLNDPRFFAREEGDGVVYGLYFPRANVAYLTPVACERTDHFVHEIGHHLFDEYDILLPNEMEEVRTRRFAGFVRRFEALQAREHVHVGEPPALAAWLAASHEVYSENGVTVRASTALTRRQVDWLRRVSRTAQALLPAYTGQGSEETPPLEVRVVRSSLLNNPRRFPAETGRVDGRYFPNHGLLYVTERAFRGADLLGHFLAHHYLAAVDLDAETAARLAYGFGYDLDRRLLSAVAALPEAELASRTVRTLEDPVGRPRATVALP